MPLPTSPFVRLLEMGPSPEIGIDVNKCGAMTFMVNSTLQWPSDGKGGGTASAAGSLLEFSSLVAIWGGIIIESSVTLAGAINLFKHDGTTLIMPAIDYKAARLFPDDMFWPRPILVVGPGGFSGQATGAGAANTRMLVFFTPLG